MPEGVNCSVSNCAFWGQGNRCQATAIHIDVDQHADMDYSAEFADEDLYVNHKDHAPTSSVTCCHTFKPKGMSRHD